MRALIAVLPALGTAVGSGLAAYFYRRRKYTAPVNKTAETRKFVVAVILSIAAAAMAVVMTVAVADL